MGWLAPEAGEAVRPLGALFIRLVKMLISPIVFTTVTLGVASMGDVRKVGRVGIKALIWFEAMTTVALVLGLIVARIVRPGAGMHIDPATLDTSGLPNTAAAKSVGEQLLSTVPDSILSALTADNVLQVVFVALLVGFALASMGERARPVIKTIESFAGLLFAVMGLVMLAAPLGAFGAMAHTVAKHGLASIGNLLAVMVTFYATALCFVVVVLGLVLRLLGLSIFRLLAFIREELVLVLGTSSSESALPSLMAKLENAGIQPAVVRLVVPTGYSFNLDGTCIYLTMATSFVAQALDIPLSLGNELAILGVLLLTSKGAAGVTGSGFVTLAATLSSVGTIPVAGLSLLLGIDRFMSEARALTNIVGNAVATIVVARWEKAVDKSVMADTIGPRKRS